MVLNYLEGYPTKEELAKMSDEEKYKLMDKILNNISQRLEKIQKRAEKVEKTVSNLNNDIEKVVTSDGYELKGISMTKIYMQDSKMYIDIEYWKKNEDGQVRFVNETIKINNIDTQFKIADKVKEIIVPLISGTIRDKIGE